MSGWEGEAGHTVAGSTADALKVQAMYDQKQAIRKTRLTPAQFCLKYACTAKEYRKYIAGIRALPDRIESALT